MKRSPGYFFPQYHARDCASAFDGRCMAEPICGCWMRGLLLEQGDATKHWLSQNGTVYAALWYAQQASERGVVELEEAARRRVVHPSDL